MKERYLRLIDESSGPACRTDGAPSRDPDRSPVKDRS